MPPTRPALALLFVALLAPMSHAADVSTPESHLGYRPGADFRLADWPTVVDYFGKVDRASNRVAVRELGKSTEGRPYVVGIVSDEATIADLPRYQALQRRLADPRGLADPAQVEAAAAGSKAVVMITCSIHSNETASTLMAMELLHDLATSEDAEAREIRARTILLLVPSANPDGVDKIAAWYERSKGHPWEGSGMIELYHKYAGHDTNRDWFMLNLAETRILTNLLYREWFPTITYDVHQMGNKGARMFVPPFFDPINPNLDPRINQGIALIGSHMAADLASAGKRGVLNHSMYDNWWNGGNRTVPQRHNMVGVLTEAASVRLASPIFQEAGELKGGSRGFADHKPAVNFPAPWPGGWWRLRDVVDYELICARSVLTLAARYKDSFQKNYAAMGLEAVARGKSEPPYAWVVPEGADDPGRARAMVEILHGTGIEVRRATSRFRADGVEHPAGTWILPADQPYRAHLKDMMERQVYPDRYAANGEAEAPYDVAGWTLPLQMGVAARPVNTPLEVESEPVDLASIPRRPRFNAKHEGQFELANRAEDDFIVLNALLSAGIDVSRVPTDRPGSTRFRFPADARSRAVLDGLDGVVSSRVADLPAGNNPIKVRAPRIGLYQPWVPSMDEGWTRLVLEKFRFPYSTLHDADVRAGGLRDRFDAVVLPSMSTASIRRGHAPGETEPAYVGGLGRDGVDAIRAFVEAGGSLVCLEGSTAFAIEVFSLPAVDVLKGLKTSEFYGPGSIVRVVGSDAPLSDGMPAEFSAYFDRSHAFELPPGGWKGEVAARYADADVLESGWLLGPEKLRGKAAVVTIERGAGRVVLFGFPPQHRGQTRGTFRLLFNALLLSSVAG